LNLYTIAVEIEIKCMFLLSICGKTKLEHHNPHKEDALKGQMHLLLHMN